VPRCTPECCLDSRRPAILKIVHLLAENPDGFTDFTLNTLHMKKYSTIARLYKPGLMMIVGSLIISIYSCQKPNEETSATGDITATDHRRSDQLKQFIRVNLTANRTGYGATNIDTFLKNAWGIAFSATGTPWIGAQDGHVSTVYNREGGTQLPAVHIPSPGGPEGGNPTGVVFNGSATDFVIPAGNGGAAAPARFIFVGVDGVVSAWNGTWGNHAYRQFNNVATSSYTGLTLAASNGVNYLYAADFRARRIVVWDKNWAPVQMSFKDSHIPWGYSPFNIQVVGDKLYVTYAKVGRDGRSEAGRGKGFVNIFSTDGKLVDRFADKDLLNAPWGVAMAAETFFPREPQPAILIGNFGDGRINAYSLKGKFLGQLMANRRILEIDGLWAITFPPSTSTIDPKRLYFAAGPNHERDGVFGYLIKDSTSVAGGHGHGNGGLGNGHGDY
jgi:uncharacterized protein (TIGR03118 family)